MYAKIFSAVFVIVTIAQVHCEKKGLSPELEKCFEKIPVTLEYLESLKFENLTKEDKSKVMCAFGCQIKADVAKNGNTIYQYLLDRLKEDNVKANVDVLTQGLNSCSNVGDDECKFIKCLAETGQEWRSRIDEWVAFVLSKN